MGGSHNSIVSSAVEESYGEKNNKQGSQGNGRQGAPASNLQYDVGSVSRKADGTELEPQELDPPVRSQAARPQPQAAAL